MGGPSSRGWGEPASGDWSHYFEPTTNELDEAFDRLLASEDHRYDAIIVDEGQDFRGTWWTIVEAALRDPSEGFLYAFHDDNQALLPDRSEYPITSAPFVLSKNCRNAGKVFDLVRRFHDQAPEPSLHLSGHGELDLRLFQADDGPAVVADVLNELLANLETARLVVLTTEYEPVSSGVLEGLVVSRRQPYNWEATVSAVFADVRRKQRVHKYRLEDLASLEQALLRAPMNEDGAVLATYATVVADIAQQARRTMFLLALFRLHPLHPRPCRWSRDGTTLRLLGMRSVDDLFAFFSDPKWVDGLAGPGPVRLVSGPRVLAKDEVRLSTTEAFKGLEADHVVLFVAGDREELAKHLYVGVSRARGSLHLVVADELHRRAPDLPLFEVR